MSTTPHSGTESELQRAKSEAKELASSAAEEAKRRGRDAADRAKEEAADRAEQFASTLESTAEELETTDGGEMLSGYGRSMAELMRRLAGGLREHEIEEFAGQLATFARRNPASFLAGSVAIGFGVSRFLKATSERPHDEYGYDDEDDEYLLAHDDDFDRDDTYSAGSYGAADSGMSTTPSPSPSAEGSTRSGGTWPEDRGRERPGAASPSTHWTPAAGNGATSAGAPGHSTLSSSSGHSSVTRTEGTTASPRSSSTDGTGTRTDSKTHDEIRRNEP